MRLIQACIDSIKDHDTKVALRELFAATLAAQAVAAAASRGVAVNEQNIRSWIEAVADYPGITMDYIDDEDRKVTVGNRAEEITGILLTCKPNQ